MYFLETSVEGTLHAHLGDVMGDITAAAGLAYDGIESRGVVRGTAHRLSVCSEASSLMVKHLVSWGHHARQEFVVVDEVGPHSYGVVVDGDEELIADLTWQQLLPKNGTEEERNLPRVLIGSRGQVMRTARSYGVAPPSLKVWEAQAANMSFEEHSLRDRAAEEEADKLNQKAWERFMAS